MSRILGGDRGWLEFSSHFKKTRAGGKSGAQSSRGIRTSLIAQRLRSRCAWHLGYTGPSGLVSIPHRRPLSRVRPCRRVRTACPLSPPARNAAPGFPNVRRSRVKRPGRGKGQAANRDIHGSQRAVQDELTDRGWEGIDVQEPGDAESTSHAPGEGVSDSRDLDADPALSAYLNDHLAGSAAGVRLAKRCREAHGGSDLGRYLGNLVGEIEEDRRVLERVMTQVGAQSNPVKQAGALGAEFLTRLKHLTPVLASGSTVARLEEIELLSLGIEGKRLLWGLLTSCLAPMIG